MPHFGLMDADALGPEEAALRRARLHIRGGKRRLRQGKISAGIVTLYDALECALQWYVSSGERRRRAGLTAEVPRGSREIFRALTDAGVLDGSLDYDSFDRLAEEALSVELGDFDPAPMLEAVEAVMRSLGVAPFDEEALPPEDPSTF